VQLIAVELQAFDELFDRSLRLEWEERQAECDVAPLTGILRKSETLAELLNNIFCLFFLLEV
jgi:hypothetical protein